MNDTSGLCGAAKQGLALTLLQLLTADPRLLEVIRSGRALRVGTPLRFPGKAFVGPGKGFVDLLITPCEGRRVRISDGGDMLRWLEQQGMDLAVDVILSKTVFHAVKEIEGAGIRLGEFYLDSTVDGLQTDVWRFLQLLMEVMGLRHSKYKDALVQLSRGQDFPDPSFISSR